MEVLALHTGAPRVHWEDNTSCISIFEAKMVTHRVKHIEIPVSFLQEQFYNGFLLQNMKSVMPVDMCTKPCVGTIIIQSTKWITGFRFYPTSDIEHYQIMRLN